MSWTPNKIVLISRGRHEEAMADLPCWPGMILQRQPDGGVAPHASYGAGAGPVMVAKEDALRGADITQILPQGNALPYQMAANGDILLMLLQNGQNVPAQTPLISAGDGTLVADSEDPLFQSTAASTAVTNTTTETTFSNGSFTIPANTLQPGQGLRISGSGTVPSQNGTDTQRIRVYIGGTTLVDFTALNLPAGSVFGFELVLNVAANGASGSVTGTGQFTYQTVPATPTSQSVAPVTQTFTLAATAIDTTATQLVKVTATASAANAADQVVLSGFRVEQDRVGGFGALVICQEAINNSTGTGTSGYNKAAFIRCMVIG